MICCNGLTIKKRLLPWAQRSEDKDGEEEKQESFHCEPWNTNTNMSEETREKNDHNMT